MVEVGQTVVVVVVVTVAVPEEPVVLVNVEVAVLSKGRSAIISIL